MVQNFDTDTLTQTHRQIHKQQTANMHQELNDKYKSKDLVALEDHPMDPEEIDGVRMNHGGLILVVIQRLSKINKHSEMLKGGEYYDKWSQENLDDVVNWRFKK